MWCQITGRWQRRGVAPVRVVQIAGSRVGLSRTATGTAVVTADDEAGFARGTGYLHARDRGRQLLVLRLVGQGRLAGRLAPTRAAVASDTWFAHHRFAADAAAAVGALDEATARLFDGYAQGVAAGFAARGTPLPLSALGYHPDPWTPADSLLLLGLASWVGLAQTPDEVSVAVLRALRAGADPDRLRALFPALLAGLREDDVARLRRLPHPPGAGPPGAPVGGGSNAWAVAGSRTASGSAVLAADPHVDIARLPGLWCELVGRVGDGPDRVGISLPGLPGLAMGRSGGFAWSFVAGYADQVARTVEDVRAGRVRRPGGWAPVVTEPVAVARRGRAPVRGWRHRTDAGVLELPFATRTVPDGPVLARRWAAAGPPTAASAAVLVRLTRCATVAEGCDLVSGAALSATWVFADAAGAVGLQQSAAVPRRDRGAAVPRPGWEPGPPTGLVDPAELARESGPGVEVVATANEPRAGRVPVVAVGGPLYRVDRIRAALDDGPVDAEACRRLQLDVADGRARALLPVLPATAPGHRRRGGSCAPGTAEPSLVRPARRCSRRWSPRRGRRCSPRCSEPRNGSGWSARPRWSPPVRGSSTRCWPRTTRCGGARPAGRPGCDPSSRPSSRTTRSSPTAQHSRTPRFPPTAQHSRTPRFPPTAPGRPTVPGRPTARSSRPVGTGWSSVTCSSAGSVSRTARSDSPAVLPASCRSNGSGVSVPRRRSLPRGGSSPTSARRSSPPRCRAARPTGRPRAGTATGCPAGSPAASTRSCCGPAAGVESQPGQGTRAVQASVANFSRASTSARARVSSSRATEVSP